ncbi:hypothetical protein Q7P35_000394 [Cladosporium inversicolor]
MSHDSNPTPKRRREDNEDNEDNDLRRIGPPQNRWENIITHENARQHLGNVASKLPDLDAVEITFESLAFEEMDARYLAIDASLAHFSCRWLLDRVVYMRWQDVGALSEYHGFLWIKGKAGAGKSTLMKFAFNNAEETRSERQTVISFFFNARGAPLERSLVGMYRALLYQVLGKVPRLRLLLYKERTHLAQSPGWSLGVLQSLSRDVIQNLAHMGYEGLSRGPYAPHTSQD